MIIWAPTFVLTGPSAYYAEANLDNPIIGWENVANIDNITATSEQALYPLENLLNTATNMVWKGSTTADQTIEIEPDTADDIDYVGIARHNFGTATISVSLSVNRGSGWVVEVPPFVPADDSPIIMRVTAGPMVGVRVILTSADVPAMIGVLYVGKLLVIQRRLYVGHQPLKYSVETEVLTGVSQAGEFMGRIVTRLSRSGDVALQNMNPLWYRAYMQPFVEAARENPFFWSWRPNTYPDEVMLAWLTNSPKMMNQRPNGMVSTQLQLGGLVL